MHDRWPGLGGDEALIQHYAEITGLSPHDSNFSWAVKQDTANLPKMEQQNIMEALQGKQRKEPSRFSHTGNANAGLTNPDP